MKPLIMLWSCSWLSNLVFKMPFHYSGDLEREKKETWGWKEKNCHTEFICILLLQHVSPFLLLASFHRVSALHVQICWTHADRDKKSVVAQLLWTIFCSLHSCFCSWCRLDTTLIDFTDMKCQRGDLSFIFNGNAIPSESFVVLDNEQRVYQRIHHEVRENLKAPD